MSLIVCLRGTVNLGDKQKGKSINRWRILKKSNWKGTKLFCQTCRKSDFVESGETGPKTRHPSFITSPNQFPSALNLLSRRILMNISKSDLQAATICRRVPGGRQRFAGYSSGRLSDPLPIWDQLRSKETSRGHSGFNSGSGSLSKKI